MINQTELNHLKQNLSNEARVLYTMYLKPEAKLNLGISNNINYREIMTLLNGIEEKYSKGRQINRLLKELCDVGLIDIPADVDLNKTVNGQCFRLPLLNLKQADTKLFDFKFAMHRDWSPNNNILDDISQLIGLIDNQYDEPMLGEFIAYWIGRPETQLSEYRWTQKFVQSIKRNNTPKTITASKQIGTQTTQKIESALEADDNAKQLVAKYSQNKP